MDFFKANPTAYGRYCHDVGSSGKATVSAGVQPFVMSLSCCLYVAHSCFLLSVSGLSGSCVQSDFFSKLVRLRRSCCVKKLFVQSASNKPLVKS